MLEKQVHATALTRSRVLATALHAATVLAWPVAGVAAEIVREPSALVDQQRCMFCHTIDTPFRGPSFRQIADRYRDVPGAADTLEAKLRAGGAAHWGNIAMPSAAQRGGGPLSREGCSFARAVGVKPIRVSQRQLASQDWAPRLTRTCPIRRLFDLHRPAPRATDADLKWRRANISREGFVT
jgi:cytochrome c551/c552